MPSFNPFSTVTGKHAASLFEIRLDNDFMVFRGGEDESAGQILKGQVVLCLPTPLKIEDVHLRLTGNLRLTWDYSKSAASGVSSQKVDKTTTLLQHRWPAFVGATGGKNTVLPAGNYEWPFEFTLPGNTAESVEGIPEASITYKLKATVARGKLAYDLHAYKALRVIRTLEPAALEFLHAMSVENIWPNKVDYSIIIPQKAVVFGASVPLQMRFTPLLKGLEMGEITVKMLEIRECTLQTPTGGIFKEHRTEREVSNWKFEVDRDEHWQDTIEDTGQEGWLVEKKLNLPKRLRQCVQDLNHNGIKVRHKLKLVVALKNPDGHISELRATLPVSIFISPNMPLDEHGVLVDNAPGNASATDAQVTRIAPPGYGEHVLDQLYEDISMSGFQTPAVQSGFNSPFYAQSRAGSSENLAQLAFANGHGVAPAALTSRLQSVSLDPSQRNTSFNSLNAITEDITGPTSAPTGQSSLTHSAALTRHNSSEEHSNSHTSGRNSPEHLDLSDLSRVPSYSTALKTPARARGQAGESLPDYFSAMSAPNTPPASEVPVTDPLSMIPENDAGRSEPTSPGGSHRTWHRPASMTHLLSAVSGSDDRRLHLLQGRERGH
ncbi:putative HECT-type ubiquitin ligase-interacting protein creD [Colletotrichum orbiculare MAFF 240422]|uniref:HECT-type ubiquitin ligase-interacting protein creD n=2 Tax=Colletotrichum orbiculare species complex TaxID=2707354 RepID=N4VGN8_COLOR|nr:putative HECT-type ubiquitin ligase-interacting protein creD [Colletotrichum orbiculare MAFF 240422]TDZ33915.1 putative HECT-type ubiquitin ligase-interacting protein creD [Colletotrichum spinosum]